MIYVHTIDQERHRCQILNGVWQSCCVGNGLTSNEEINKGKSNLLLNSSPVLAAP